MVAGGVRTDANPRRGQLRCRPYPSWVHSARWSATTTAGAPSSSTKGADRQFGPREFVDPAPVRSGDEPFPMEVPVHVLSRGRCNAEAGRPGSAVGVVARTAAFGA